MTRLYFRIRAIASRAGALSIAIGAMVAALAAPALAQQCVVLDDFSSSAVNGFPAGWKPREPAGKSVYVVAKQGDMLFVRARAKGSRSEGNGIEADRPVKWNLEEYPILRWLWRPRVFPQGTNESSGKDDSVLGVYIGFCPPEDLALCERSLKGELGLKDRIVLPKLLLSKGAGSLKYIWSEQLPKGFEFEKRRKAVKVLESGVPANRGQWVEERVNIASDYRRRFGLEKLLNPVGISILTDSDDTGSENPGSAAEGDYAEFKLCRQ